MAQIVLEHLQFMKENGYAFTDEEAVGIFGCFTHPDSVPPLRGHIQYLTRRKEIRMEIVRYAPY